MMLLKVSLAPIQTRWIRHRPQAPWYDDNLRQAKRINAGWRVKRKVWSYSRQTAI